MSETLGAVIDRARAGDKQAFSQLVVRCLLYTSDAADEVQLV